MALVSLRNVKFAWGSPALMEDVDLDIEVGDRIGLLGRNGAGKSTLMKIIARELKPDSGDVLYSGPLRVARLIQEVPEGDSATVSEIVTEGHPTVEAGKKRNQLEDEVGWQVDHEVDRILSKMKLSGDVGFSTLSSGKKRRVLLAKTLISDPDVLLLDEPTNHLDIDSILWLEQFFGSYRGTLVFVTHDRSFLRALANRIVEVDRGRLFAWACDYDKFLERKEEALDAEDKIAAQFDKKLAQEEAWIRQGIKARRTRNEGRVRALKALRKERAQRRERVGVVKMEAAEAERSGKLVIEAKNVSYSYDDTPVISDFSCLLTQGDKIGIIGPNGSGKTTLLKLLLGQLQPTSGSVRQGTKQEIVYFDQLRLQIDDEKTVIENVGQGRETVRINGREKHIYGYLEDFLFTPDRSRLKARFLSGGERNRLLLARLFTKPSNIMVLDEPTNDLDAETLELLEELVSNYKGTLLLVSHDRAFLNNVVTSTLAFEDHGLLREYAGGYDDYLSQREAFVKAKAAAVKSQVKPKKAPTERPKKLSFKLKQELEALPDRIEALENEHAELLEVMGDPEFFKKTPEEMNLKTERFNEVEKELAEAFKRWEELDAI